MVEVLWCWEHCLYWLISSFFKGKVQVKSSDIQVGDLIIVEKVNFFLVNQHFKCIFLFFCPGHYLSIVIWNCPEIKIKMQNWQYFDDSHVFCRLALDLPCMVLRYHSLFSPHYKENDTIYGRLHMLIRIDFKTEFKEMYILIHSWE